MLHNFQLAAVVRTGGKTRLLRVPLHQGLQRELAQTWQGQYDQFADGIDEIDFVAGYQPEEDERFRLQPFESPEWLASETSQSARNLDPITSDDALLDATRAIAAFARNEAGVEVVLFQNFSRAHVIRPGRFLFLENNTYQTTARPGLTLDGKLSAVCMPADKKLLFQNFRIVNTFISLGDIYEEASEQDIKEVLAHTRLAPEDPDALAKDASQWFRTRFAMLRDSGILDEYSAKAIQARSSGYPVDVRISKGRVVFPAEKAAAKKLLQFLNEELYRGPITKTVFETNSKKEAGK
jgi:hypothetical protein